MPRGSCDSALQKCLKVFDQGGRARQGKRALRSEGFQGPVSVSRQSPPKTIPYGVLVHEPRVTSV
jgi:hypothetical protein